MESLQPGDACVECLNQGLNHKLRYFYLNLEEQLLKCESRSCLWPHNDSVSSDEDDVVAESTLETTADVVEDDDEFIKQLLEQLGPGDESTEMLLNPASSSNASPSATSSVDDILSLSDLWTNAQQLQTDNSSITKHSLKSLTAETLPNLQHCDELSPVAAAAATTSTYSMPALLSESSITPVLRKPPEDQTEPQLVKLEATQAAGAIEPTISYTISFPPQVPQQPITKSSKTNDTPKVKLFQTPLMKASTMALKQPLQQQAEKEPTALPSTMATAPIQISSFLDALKRPAAAPRPARGGRRQPRSRRDNVGGAQVLSGGILALKQKLERLEALSRQREIKADSEPET